MEEERPPSTQLIHCIINKALLLSSSRDPQQHQQQQQQQQQVDLQGRIEQANSIIGDALASACNDACQVQEVGRTETPNITVLSFSAVSAVGASFEQMQRALTTMLQLTVFPESAVYRQLPYGCLIIRLPHRFLVASAN
ncbi:hypothetical protein ACSSS7_001964 [Eimeria intestinalis]